LTLILSDEEQAMNCPRCSGSTLDEREREGVTIDICRQCRGIWLDRGELEKLISRERRDWDDYEEEERRARASWDARAPRYPEHKRKKGFLHTLGDLFD
jgi:Zn-finger nucleic acid-binding protein